MGEIADEDLALMELHWNDDNTATTDQPNDFVEQSNGRYCRHGHLARKCELCSMETDIASRDAEIEKLKATCERAWAEADQNAHLFQHMTDIKNEVGGRLKAEIERIKAAHANTLTDYADYRLRHGKRTDDLVEEREQLRAEIERLKALVEKRERQIVWAVNNYAAVSDYEPTLFSYTPMGDEYRHETHSFDGTTAGLLAAIDEEAK